MLYYDYKIKTKEKNVVPSKRGNPHLEWVSTINDKAEELEKTLPYNIHFYLVDVSSNVIHACGVIGYKNKENPEKYLHKYITEIGLNDGKIETEEISIHDFAHDIHQAENNGFVRSENYVLNVAALGSLRDCVKKDYQEEIINGNLTFEEAKSLCLQSSYCKSMLEEIERIYAGEKKPFIGHPVHYIIYSDDFDVAKDIVKTITSALYYNERVKSKRVSFLQPTKDEDNLFDEDKTRLNMDFALNLSTMQKGGTIVLQPGEVIKESNVLKVDDLSIEKLAKLIDNNKVETLHFIVLGKNEKKVAEKLKMELHKTRFVEFEELPFDKNRATEMLKKKAEEDSITVTSSLFDLLPQADCGYYMADVNKIYNQWLSEKLPLEMFPQYSDIKLPNITLATVKGSAYDKLNSLIGLDSVKKVIKQALDFNKAQALYEKAGLKSKQPTRHMVFTGNPGTAKTTVARLYAQIMKDNGVLSKGDLIEVGRQDLVGKYVGWTAKQVEEAFMKANGSVLFIDEAYSLCEDCGGSFGDEAINTIVQLMENHRNNTVVIFAGYPDKMEEFLNRNPGLRSRIAYNVNFEDYSTEELVQIFKLIASESSINLDNGVVEKVTEILDSAKNQSDFGNGRFARNLFEQSLMQQASRLVQMDPNALSDEQIKSLTVDDIYTNFTNTNKQESRILGFAC